MKKVLIIGGSTGVGRALAEQLSQESWEVIATYHNTPQSSKGHLSYHQLDVMDVEADVSFIPDQLDALVYCPGSIVLKPFKRLSDASFLEDYKLQVLGAIRLIRQCLPALQNSELSSVLLFSTVAVQSGYNFHSQVAVSKGAIEGLTRSLAAEFAPKIRVNCIAPSLTDTPLAHRILSTDEKRQANAQRHPLKRIGSASDISEMAAFLLSEKASWITGQVLHVDGGMSSIKM